MKARSMTVRLLSILLCLTMVVGILPATILRDAFKVSAAEDPVVVIAGSDFQNTGNNHTQGAAYVTTLLNQIKEAGYTTADGFLFAGDYDYGYNDSDAGKEALQGVVQNAYGTGLHEVYVEGNHDNPDNSSNSDLVANGTLSPSGANDAADYGVYVIHESDYMWYNDDETTIKNTASALDAYLDAKVEDGYTKPIFVVSHLPLHYNMRTKNDGDGMYANYIFDVLNEGGAAGLNIIFLFGHNHSNGWDDYLGGSAIYLAKGEEINIAQSSKTAFDVETLNFTYMNAGYVAYYRNVNTGSETDLTMTVFEITDDKVTVKRFSENGLHDLKSKGVTNSYKSESGYDPNTTVYESPQTIELDKSLAPEEAADTASGVTVAAPGITGVTVAKSANSPTELYSAYVTYDITPAGYTQGDSARVTVAVDTDLFDANRPVLVIDEELGTTVQKSIRNGEVTFDTTHFSEYSIAQYDAGVGVSADGYLTATTFERVTTLEQGVGYLIVPKQGNVLTLTGTASGNALLLSGGLTADNTNLWYYNNGNLRYQSATGAYLRVGSQNGRADVSTSNNDTTRRINSVTLNNDGESFTLKSGNNYYLNRYGGGGATIAGRYNEDGNANDGSAWYFYKVVTGTAASVTLTVTPGSLSLMPGDAQELVSTVLVGGAAASRYTITWTSNNTDVAKVENGVVTGVADGTANITATLTSANGQSVDGTLSVTIPVTVQTRKVTDIKIDPMTGTVERGAKGTTPTGSTMTITYDDGETVSGVPVTVSMLSGEGLNISKNGTYTGLTVTYGGCTVGDYTLNVVNVSGNDFPNYPEGGSVRVDKTAAGQDFQNTGVARVELSTSGLPAQKGADVVVVIDTSSSMDTEVGGKSRIDVLSESLQQMLTQFQTTNATTGLAPDIDIAIIDFNGYYPGSSAGDFDKIDLSGNNTSYRSNQDNAKLFTGTNSGSYIRNVVLSASDFVDVSSVNAATIAGQFTENTTTSGTNYDGALENAYNLLAAKKAANTEDRDQYVIFLSDGAPYRYNGLNNGSNQNYTAWNDWLTGKWADAAAFLAQYPNNKYTHFYNGNGNVHPHRYAEAIKGTEGEMYAVVDRDAQDLGVVEGLGATIYSVGFCLTRDGASGYGYIEVETMQELIRVISSGEGYYYENVNSADQLANAFTNIVSEINYAAQNAYFVDQMGTAFDLQMNPTIPKSDGSTTTDISTDITVTSYDIYTVGDVGKTIGGHTVTLDDVGKVYGTGTELEKVSFAVDADGNLTATSTAKAGDILVDGVICANTFWYNTTNSVKMIDLNGDGTPETELAPETFYWNIGLINEKQFTLSYAVYLTGSMDGDVPGGSYDTNNYATLSYTNWLGNDVSQSVASPTMAWKSANVSYAFYLVDGDGNPLAVDGTTITNIINAYKVTQPVVYDTINLNSEERVLSAIAKDVLPDGYTLYDENAVYKIEVNSGDGGGTWTITGNHPESTYVTGYAGAQDYSNATPVSEPSYDYTHTTVYFAVVWTIGTVPDAVVIDFGLPVDISVLANDMFGSLGELVGIGPVNAEGKAPADGAAVLANGFGETFGEATTNGNKVRFTPGSMEMNEPVVFAYAVHYTGATNSGYYYGTVTVIPATTVYFEDSFLTLESYTVTDGVSVKDDTSAWTQEGTTVSGATQGEDRPGEYSRPEYDANNIYGYDGAYTNLSTHSLGSAAKITVNANCYGTASFTFYGTGFDVVSMTSNQTGYIRVLVKDENDEEVVNKLVDTYYGMNADGSVSFNDPNALYQVPVIKVSGLGYGKYEVEITATYNSFFDHTGTTNEDGSKDGYDLYLDAIRIYDPTGNLNETANGAYVADGEGWPEYEELRNNIIAANTFDASNTEAVNGIVFIDSNDNNYSIADYVSYGPNNELYLAPGQAIAFNVTTDDNVADVQLGIKVGNFAEGSTKVTYKINDVEKEVATTTDMYYSIMDYVSGTVVIQNTSGGILSLTNIKVTHKEAPVDTAAAASLLWIDEPTATFALMSLRSAPAVEEPVVEVFQPEKLEVSLNKSEVKVGDKIKVTVKTGDDVAYLTVNGQTVTDYSTNRRTGERTWTVNLTAEAVGELTVDVVAYSAEDVASEPVTNTVTVNEKKDPKEVIRDILEDLFGWLFG